MGKSLWSLVFCTLLSGASWAAVGSHVTRVVGGDISLVPAYESAGDMWLDADGNVINTTYSDGMITYLRDEAGWTSMRVRLLVDPSQDSYLATCQDLDYVKALGKRIKDAGMHFLLDIFYSDTWTDVSKQWIPAGWGYGKNTETSAVAAKVKSYTTEVLNALVAYGAAPDYVQIGNEVSYGMLWDSASGASTSNAFYTSETYSKYSSQISRFAALLTAAAEGVRASDASEAKIVLHCERTISSSQSVNFYTWVEQAGFSDYDIIGLSYYPAWHGSISTLQGTLSSLATSFPNKEIQIVETAYYNSDGVQLSSTESSYCTWSLSPSGQASFLSDLTTALNNCSNVTGLYYWQPEECGNGANSAGVNQVMDSWDNRGFWTCSWKSGSHSLQSESALLTLQNFHHTALGEESEEDELVITDITSDFQNMDFEDCTWNDGGWVATCPGWSLNYDLGFSTLWPCALDGWESSLVGGSYRLSLWNAASNTVSAGDIIYQTLDNLPAGTYTLSAVVHTDYSSFYLFANNEVTQVTSAGTDWGTAYEITVTATLEETGSLTIGLRTAAPVSTSSEVNLYADNFTVTQTLLRGDVNLDGQVDVNDVTALVDIILGTWGSQVHGNADINADSEVDVNDVTALVDIILGK